MRPRTILVFGLLAAAASAPVVFSGKGIGSLADDLANGESLFGFASSKSDSFAPSPADINGSMGESQQIFVGVFDLREVFRFDIDPTWVKSHWLRISNCPGEDKLTGLRVPLVTGALPNDLHGSLTYYFDQEQRVQRINFKGWTGDPSRLVALVTQEFGFSARRSTAYAFYTAQSWGKRKGVLRMDHASVIRGSLPNEQVKILFEITNPKNNLAVSERVSEILRAIE